MWLERQRPAPVTNTIGHPRPLSKEPQLITVPQLTCPSDSQTMVSQLAPAFGHPGLLTLPQGPEVRLSIYRCIL